MKRTLRPLSIVGALAALTITLAQCSSKSSDPTPLVNPIPANSAALKVDGVPFPVEQTHNAAFINKNTGKLEIQIFTSQWVGGPSVIIYLDEFRNQVEKIQLGANTQSRILLSGGVLSTQSSSLDCNPQAQEFEVVEVNQTAKTVSLKFSGKVCGGQNSNITDGQVNVHYTLI